jgi:hypothetical protein
VVNFLFFLRGLRGLRGKAFSYPKITNRPKTTRQFHYTTFQNLPKEILAKNYLFIKTLNRVNPCKSVAKYLVFLRDLGGLCG